MFMKNYLKSTKYVIKFIYRVFNPLYQDDLIKRLNIKYILSCVDYIDVRILHQEIISNNPEIIILNLPLKDNLLQNLWIKNKDNIYLSKNSNYFNDHDAQDDIVPYKNKSMIEIGFHFINNAICQNSNILVHCMAGVSRSSSIIIYYLMKKYNFTYQYASSICKK